MLEEGIKYRFLENTAGVDRRWLDVKLTKNEKGLGVLKNEEREVKGKTYISGHSGGKTKLIRLTIRRSKFKYNWDDILY